MCRVIRRVLRLGGVLTLLGLAACGGAHAVAPEGPRLALTQISFNPARADLLTVDATGALPVRLAGKGARSRFGLEPLSRPSWSPDGSLIAFAAGLNEKGPRETRQIFVVRPDGTGLRPLRGTRGGSDPVFAPDGRSLVFSRYKQRTRPGSRGRRIVTFASTSVWRLDLDDGRQRRLTSLRNGLHFFAYSFSPDGSALALTRIDDKLGEAFDAVLLWLAKGDVELLAAEAQEPMFSPDGSALVLVRESFRGGLFGSGRELEETSDLYLLDREHLSLRRLTRTPGKYESAPSWDPSGSRLAYVETPNESLLSLFSFGNAVMEINSDGSCRHELTAYPRLAFYGVAWQPGVGREAGRISCRSPG
jgi:Tol biopolymer transport system component